MTINARETLGQDACQLGQDVVDLSEFSQRGDIIIA